MDLTTGIQGVKGVGEKSAALYAKLNIRTVGDLLRFYPRGYERFEAPVNAADAVEGEVQSFDLRIVKSATMKKVRNLTILNFIAADNTGQVGLTFFNMPFLKNTLKAGETYIFRGVFREGKLEQPRFFKENDYRKLCESIQPSYSLTKGITNNSIKKAVAQVLSHYDFPQDHLPLWIREKYSLMGYEEAVHTMHFPDNMDKLVEARRRLVFDEFFLFVLLVRRDMTKLSLHKSPFAMIETADVPRLVESLPYKLTAGQKKVLSEICANMTSGNVMSRLIQGDVGSGKTVLAVLALLLCASNGYQGALMAPTEVLATQHFETIVKMTEQYKLPFKPILLTGSTKAKEKKETYEAIKDGRVNLIIGTHALIQDKVEYKNLALVITDEQHRFGVRQRETLANKGSMPHILVMSATPIPRSLALILYGDLDISVIKELPSERLPIKNCVVGTKYRSTAYKFIEKEVSAGHQVYIICPMVEEGSDEGMENVVDYTEKLKTILPPSIQISCLHGKMRPAMKQQIMEEFYSHNIDVLVSTTVIEVGINVPNATVMMIENAERFGLAQLHQLRGRVGRGDAQSYCIFISSNDKKETMNRLEILNKSNDGFFIASEDMRLRGPGDLFGIRQSGDMEFKIADIYQDSDVLKEASECVDRIYEGKGDISPDILPYFIESLENQIGNHIDFQSI